MFIKFKSKMVRLFLVGLVSLLAVATGLVSALVISEIETDAFGSAGGRTSSTNFETYFIAGQSSPTDISISSNFSEIGGFLALETVVPDIMISMEQLDYGAVFIGTSVPHTLLVSNVGTGLLTVTDISSDNSDYIVQATSFSLAPGDSQEVLITFTPTTSGVILGTLTIPSDDPDENIVSVSLQGEGLIPPDFWEPVNSSPGGTISAFAFNASGDIFAGGSGVHRSMDNGNSWTFLGNVLGDQGISDLVISSSGTIFAGTGRAVYSSSNNGDNWTFHLVGFIDGIGVRTLAINSNGDVFAGTPFEGMFRSTDSGNTWTQIRREEIFDIVVNANDDVFIGTRSGVFRSTDNGTSWESASNGMRTNPLVLTLGVNVNNDLFAYELNEGLFRSTDNGDNWTGILNRHVFSAFAFNSEGHIFAGGCTGCTPIPGAYRSTDGGENWTEINGGLASLNVATLATGNDDQIFAGTPEGVFRGVELTTAVDEPAASIPSFFALKQNYPNPFNPETVIRFYLPKTRNVILKIYNVLGEEIRRLVDAGFTSGIHSVQWDGKDNNGNTVSSGIYFYQLQAGSFAQVKKMTLLR